MSKIFNFFALAFIVVAAIIFINTVEAGSNKVALNYCPHKQTCSTTDWQCQSESYPINTCLNRVIGFNGKSVVFRCSNQASICINATGYSDSACTQKQSDLNAVCTTCATSPHGQLQYDCGGLFDMEFVLSDCNAGCGNCTTSRVPFNSCKAVPGVGYAIICGEADCVGVQVEEYAAGSGCPAGSSTLKYSLWNDQCFNGLQLTCLN